MVPTIKGTERVVLDRFWHKLKGGTPGKRVWSSGWALYWYDRPAAVWSQEAVVILVKPSEPDAVLHRLRTSLLHLERFGP
jgi:hypothetical protein